MFAFFTVLVLAAASMSFVIAFNADDKNSLNYECRDDLTVDVEMGLPSEPCTPNDTWCETRGCGARMATCGAGGTWGSWVGCGRFSACDNEGNGGSC